MKTARKPATQTAAQIIAAAPDLFDPYAPDDDPLQPDPINWSDEVTNGISLAPSIDRCHRFRHLR